MQETLEQEDKNEKPQKSLVPSDESRNEGGFLNDLSENKKKISRKVKKKTANTVRMLKHGLVGFVIGSIATVIVCGLVFDIGRNYKPSEGEYDLTVLQEKIEQCNELATATYLYTDAESYEADGAIFGLFDIPYLTGKDFILKFDGKIKAGVNLDDTRIERGGDGSVLVTLSAPYIISHELDEESFKVLREHETVFSSIKIDDIQNFRSAQKDLMEQRAYDVGVMEQAAENAQESIRSILEVALPEGTKIEFLQQ